MDIVVNVGATRPRPAVLTAHDLSTAGWTLDPMRPEATTLVVGGRHISVDAIGRITVQDAAVRAETLTWIDPDDRGYAAAEMTAALTTWLGDVCWAGRLAPAPTRSHPAMSRTAAVHW